MLENLEMRGCLYIKPYRGNAEISVMGYRGRYSRILGRLDRIVENGQSKNHACSHVYNYFLGHVD